MLGQSGFVHEIVVVYRCDSKGRHKAKHIYGMNCFTTTRGGNCSLKVIHSIQALMIGCKAILTNVLIQKSDTPASAPKGEFSYEEVEEAVLNWGARSL